MRQIVGVLKRKDSEEYMRLGKLALKINKILAVTEPLLAAGAAVGSAFVGSAPFSWGLALAVGLKSSPARQHAAKHLTGWRAGEDSFASLHLSRDRKAINDKIALHFLHHLNSSRKPKMASLHASPSMISASSSSCKTKIMATLHTPKLGTIRLNNPSGNTVEGLLRMAGQYTTPISNHTTSDDRRFSIMIKDEDQDSTVSTATFISELYMIADAVADRVEMHTNIGEQRDNWNTLLLTSINTINLTAATMAALSAAATSSLLFSAAAGMMVLMNKIQPSQLAEEQRNAARLFKQLHREIQTTLAIGRNPTARDVKDVMEKVLALDRAYPLPLLGAMLDKFPSKVEPTVWWPSSSPNSSPQEHQEKKGVLVNNDKVERNGWSEQLEEEMRQIVEVLKRKDSKEYMRLGKLVLKINKILAISGPLLAGIAAVGSAFVGSAPSHGGLALAVSLATGATASVVNTLEHGGQVGMVFEMYRNSAGFFKLLEESIESTLDQKDVERRENGEFFELKVALQLGRSLSELRDLASHASSSFSSISRDAEATIEFASKLF